MGMLHEVLAVEKTKSDAANHLLTETGAKFGKEHFFSGHVKTLKMIADTPENEAMSKAAREERALPTTVYDTLEYMFALWAEAEDVIFQKNVTNTKALADVELNGLIIATDIPVDELLGLEVRLDKIRGVLKLMPTIDAARSWDKALDRGQNVWVTRDAQTTSKTEKTMIPVVLAEATKEHPAQVKESTKDIVVGTFEKRDWSGAVTAVQKANCLKRIDDLIAAVKAARMRANKTEVIPGSIGLTISNLILETLK
jgi:hypothetical protein